MSKENPLPFSATKRLFLGLQAHAPWPENFPEGRLLDEVCRHMTLVFLGNIPIGEVQGLISSIPPPPFKVGIIGFCDKLLFLPSAHPHVVAYNVEGIATSVFSYQSQLLAWQREHSDQWDARPFLPHVTIARTPFSISEWKKAFIPFPIFFSTVVLYESIGHLDYRPLWSFPLEPPFEEKEHMADIAYLIKASTLQDLYNHAIGALAFRFPSLLCYYEPRDVLSLADIVIELNALIARADSAIGCPFKAVSFHGEIIHKQEVLEWEMIVDV